MFGRTLAITASSRNSMAAGWCGVQNPRHDAAPRGSAEILADEMAGDPRAIERLRREAHATSALNYPNICTIHDIDEALGRQFLVIEFLDGQSLKQRIAPSSS